MFKTIYVNFSQNSEVKYMREVEETQQFFCSTVQWVLALRVDGWTLKKKTNPCHNFLPLLLYHRTCEPIELKKSHINLSRKIRCSDS